MGASSAVASISCPSVLLGRQLRFAHLPGSFASLAARASRPDSLFAFPPSGFRAFCGNQRQWSAMKRSATDAAARRRWPVMAIVVGDGSRGRSGRVLKAGEVYFSCQAKSDVDHFWKPETVPMELIDVPDQRERVFETYPLRGVPLPAYLLDRNDDEGRCRVKIFADCPAPSGVATLCVIVHARQFPGTVVVIDGVGARAEQPELGAFHANGGRAPFQGGGCLQMAMLNAIAAVRGAEDAKLAEEEVRRIARSVQSVRRVGHLMRELPVAIGVLAKSEELADALHRGRSRQARMVPFRFFAKEKPGVYIVHLKQDGVVDHAVCVDCDKRLIWDSEEKSALTLTVESLVLCGGPEPKWLRIEDARRVVPRKT